MFNKLSRTTLAERMACLAAEIMGHEMLVAPPGDDMAGDDPHAIWRKRYYWALAHSIAGGTTNIQRNIIAERALGLPRDAKGTS